MPIEPARRSRRRRWRSARKRSLDGALRFQLGWEQCLQTKLHHLSTVQKTILAPEVMFAAIALGISLMERKALRLSGIGGWQLASGTVSDIEVSSAAIVIDCIVSFLVAVGFLSLASWAAGRRDGFAAVAMLVAAALVLPTTPLWIVPFMPVLAFFSLCLAFVLAFDRARFVDRSERNKADEIDRKKPT